MNLTEITSVEYADRHSPGCAWHNDPACLCDVDRSKFIVGDGPYDIPPDLVRRWCDALEDDEGDEWFTDAYEQMWADTMFRKGMTERMSEVLSLIERHPDECRALMDRTMSAAEVHSRVTRWGGVLTDVVRLLGVAPAAYGTKAEFAYPPIVRAEVLRMYDEEGMAPKDIHAAIVERGVDLKYQTMYGWIRRFAKTWTGQRPGRPIKEAA